MPEKIEELKTEILALRKQFYAGYDKLNPNEVPINGFFAMMEMSFRKLHAISLLALNEKQSPPSQNGWIDIKSAPKNTELLCYQEATGLFGSLMGIGRIDEEGYFQTSNVEGPEYEEKITKPTYFQYLPQPPIKGE